MSRHHHRYHHHHHGSVVQERRHESYRDHQLELRARQGLRAAEDFCHVPVQPACLRYSPSDHEQNDDRQQALVREARDGLGHGQDARQHEERQNEHHGQVCPNLQSVV